MKLLIVQLSQPSPVSFLLGPNILLSSILFWTTLTLYPEAGIPK
jgi:hypothetical protein